MNGFPVRVIPEWVLERWILVAYLIINWRLAELGKQIEIRPEEGFFKVVAQHLNAYIQDGVMPPEDIAQAILNLADDQLAGKPMTLRAGDYIAIQNHLRRG